MSQPTKVYVTQDNLWVRVDCTLELDLRETLVAEITQQLETLGLGGRLTHDQIMVRILDAAKHGLNITGLVLIHGEAPTPPVDGAIHWTRDFFSSPFVEDPETGKLDYRQHRDNSIVSAGSELARLTMPQPGKEGHDVFGRSIHVPKPITPKIRAGAGTRFDEASHTFHSTLDGRVRFARGVVSVDQTYSIVGSVGLKTGHVKHPGTVNIAKDIESGSRVEAGGSVRIGGALEESEVIAGGDVFVAQGILGGHKTKVQAGGAIEAMFAENAQLSAEQDIRIHKELIQCDTDTHGALDVSEGQLIGGIARAVGGIDVGQAGSHGGVPTILIAGVDPNLDATLAPRRAEIEKCNEEIHQTNEAIAPLKKRLASLTPKLRERLTELYSVVQLAEERRAELNSEMEHIIAESHARSKGVIRIRRRAYPETRLQIGKSNYLITTEVTGPVIAVIDEEGDITFRPDVRA